MRGRVLFVTPLVGVVVLAALLVLFAKLEVHVDGVRVPVAQAATAIVDGRVTASDGYGAPIADVMGGSIDYGDIFATSDGSYRYFALRLNGPTTGGAVVNENVYGATAYHALFATGWGNHNFGI